MKFATFQGSMNGARFVEFIEKLRKDVQRPLIIVADNAPYHRSQAVKDYVADSRGKVVLEGVLPTNV